MFRSLARSLALRAQTGAILPQLLASLALSASLAAAVVLVRADRAVDALDWSDLAS